MTTATPTEPNVVSLPVTDTSGAPVRITVGTDIVDVMQPARTFGREDLADPAAHGRFQRRVVALPDVRDGVVTPMLLTIATNDDFYLVRRKPGDGADWSTDDLGVAFAGAVGGAANIRALGAAATADDRIAVAVAVDEGVGPAAASRIFVAYDLSSARTDWSAVPWVDCGSRPGVRVEAIRVLDAGDGTWTVVCAGTQGPNETVYLLRSADRGRPFAKALVFTPGASLQELLDFEAGVHPTFGAGLYVLGTSGRTRVLQFRPFPDYDRSGRARTVPPIVDLPCPDGANVVEAGPTDADGTDLYIGGRGVGLITAVQQDEHEDAEIVVVAPAGGMTDVIDVALSPAPGAPPVVWARRANGDLNIITPATDGGWGNRLVLRTGIQEIAPVACDAHQTASIVAIRGDGAATQLWRDAATGAWHEAAIPVDDPHELMTHTCFGTTIRLLDDAGMPRTGARVTVSASALTSVSLNGATTYLGPGIAVETTTDANGSITLYDRVVSLTPATYRFSVDTLPDAFDVNPAAGIHERFRRITPDDLRTAQVTAPDGSRTPLLDAEGLARPLDAVARALNEGSKLASSSDGEAIGVRIVGAGAGVGTRVFTDAVPDGYAWGVRSDAGKVQVLGSAEVQTMPTGTDSAPSGFGDTLADFLERMAAEVEAAVTLVMRKVEDAVEFVCEIAGTVSRWVLGTLEEIGAFFTWLWEKIEVGLEKVWQWLRFVVDWQDILRVRDALVELANQQLTHLEGEIRNGRAKVGAGFDLLTAQIDTWRRDAGLPPKRIPPPKPGTSARDTVVGTTTPGGQDARDKAEGNPVVSWVTSQLATMVEGIVTFEGPSPVDRLANGAIDFVEGLAGDQMAAFQECIDTIGQDLRTLFGETAPSLDELSFDTLRTAVIAVGTEALRGIIDGLRALVLRAVDLAADVVAALRDGLFMTVRFPFIEKLVALVSPGTTLDTSFRLIDGMMLLVAVPATIGYKVMFGEPPLQPGEVIDLPFGRVQVQVDGALAPDKQNNAGPSNAELLKTIGEGASAATALGSRFSWVVHLAVATIKLGKSAYDVGSAATASTQWAPDPSKLWIQGFGNLLFVCGLGAEVATRHTDRGETVKQLEWTAISVTTLQVTKSMAVLVYQIRKGEPLPQAKAVEGVLDIVAYIVHFVLYTATYATMLSDNAGKRTGSASQAERDRLALDDAVLSLLWVEEFFSHMSYVLSSTAVVAQTPQVKAGTVIGALGTRAVALGLAVATVVVSGEAKRSISA
jgi:hypothetical protein